MIQDSLSQAYIQFLPHGFCINWSPKLLVSYVLSHALIAIAYYVIPIALIYLLRKRPDIKTRKAMYLLSAFIVACGSTHLMSIVMIWKPLYWIDATLMAFTAIISIVSAIYLWKIMPQLINLPSAEKLQSLNRALQESEQRFRISFETAAIGMALVSLDGRWLKVNKSLLDMLGYTESEFLQSSFQDITHPADLESDLAYIKNLLMGKINSFQMEKRYYHKDKSIIWVLLSVSLVRDSNGDPIHFVSQIEDITERREARELHFRLAYYDGLTGLPNRRFLSDRMSLAVHQAKRYGRLMAVMYIDVDNFKMVNDIHGHDVGDQLLKYIANKLSASVRDVDTVSRQGGDEFVIVLTEISKPEDATKVAESIMGSLRDPLGINSLTIDASVSIGIAIYVPPNDDTEFELMKKADMALYQVKLAGRNNYRVYTADSHEGSAT